MKTTLLAGASRFAHLLRPATAVQAADNSDDDDKQREGESDEDYAKRKNGKKAEDDKKKEDEARAKKAEEEGDDDSDEEDEDEPSARTARSRERARCAAIFASPAAALNPAAAAHLAFETKLPRSQAIAVLTGMTAGMPAAAARRPTLDDRMRAVEVPVVGPGDPAPGGGNQSQAATAAAAIIAAGKKRRGEA